MTTEELIRYCEEQAEFYKPVTEGRSVFTAIASKLRTQDEELGRQSQKLRAAEELAHRTTSFAYGAGSVDDLLKAVAKYRAAGGSSDKSSRGGGE